jgi:hypothetical protein
MSYNHRAEVIEAQLLLETQRREGAEKYITELTNDRARLEVENEMLRKAYFQLLDELGSVLEKHRQ